MATIMAPDLAQNASSSRMDHLVASQADLSLKSKTAPVYSRPQQFQSNNGATVTLSTTGPAQSVWQLPGDVVFNFGESDVTFDLNLPASAASFTVVQTDVVPIDNIQLQTSGGSTLLGALYNVQSYCKNIQAICKPLDDYLSEGAVYANTTVAGAYYSQNVCCQPTGALLAAQAATVPGSGYAYSTAAASGTYVGSAAAIAADSGTDKSYLGKQRLAVGSAANAVVIMRYKIPFSAFVGTMLADNRDYLLGQNFQIVINWSALNRFVYSANQDAVVGATCIAYAPAAGSASLTNLYLNMAKELNSDIVNELRAKVYGSGMEVLVPYTTTNRTSTSSGSGVVTSGSNFSTNFTLTPGMGIALKRILNVPVRASDQDALANCNDNVNAHLYMQVQSFLDAQPIQPAQLNAGTNNQDFWYMRGMIKDTPAGLSLREFQINSFWLDNFSDSAASAKNFIADDTCDSGLRINDTGKNYNVVFGVTANTGMILYQYITFVRKLIIKPSGLQWGA